MQAAALTTYLNQLRLGCTGEIKPGDFWLKQLTLGKKQFPEYLANKPQVHTILLRLSREEAQEEQCRLLLNLQ